MTVDNPIYALIPAIYRNRDASLGLPLAAFTEVLDLEYQAMRRDVDLLYDQWFIETCARWAVPYIGTLVGVKGIDTDTANVPTQRARVANTVGYRARRGVAATLANACSDASGWPAIAIEYFERLIVSENVNSLEWPRLRAPADDLSPATVDVSDLNALVDIDGPFARIARTVDVRSVGSARPFVHGSTPEDYNLDNIGLFMWRLRALPLWGSTPGRSRRSAGHYTFHPLGIDTPLRRSPAPLRDTWKQRNELQIPLQLTRTELAATLRSLALRGEGHRTDEAVFTELGFRIRYWAGAELGFVPLAPSCIEVANLADSGGAASTSTSTSTSKSASRGPHVRVDPETGRFDFEHGSEEEPELLVDWAWGQAGWIGGGAYDRQASMSVPSRATTILLVGKLAKREGGEREELHATLTKAWAKVEELRKTSIPGQPLEVLIRVLDSCTYSMPSSFVLDKDDNIVIEAINGERPTLCSDSSVPVCVVSHASSALFTLSGCLLACPLAFKGRMSALLVDCTVAPPGTGVEHHGAAISWLPAKQGEGAFELGERELVLARCIVGPIEAAAGGPRVVASQTIIDGGSSPALRGPKPLDGLAFGPSLVLDAATVLGPVYTSVLEAVRDSILVDEVYAAGLNEALLGEGDFSVELGLDPRADPNESYRIVRQSWLVPRPFSSTRYGDPGYCQLRLSVGEHLLSHASEDREFGAYAQLATGQRLANLEPVLDSYLPYGLYAGIFMMDETSIAHRKTRTRGGCVPAGGKL